MCFWRGVTYGPPIRHLLSCTQGGWVKPPPTPPIRVWVQDCPPPQKSVLNRPRPDQDQPGTEPLQCMHTAYKLDIANSPSKGLWAQTSCDIWGGYCLLFWLCGGSWSLVALAWYPHHHHIIMPCTPIIIISSCAHTIIPYISIIIISMPFISITIRSSCDHIIIPYIPIIIMSSNDHSIIKPQTLTYQTPNPKP